MTPTSCPGSSTRDRGYVLLDVLVALVVTVVLAAGMALAIRAGVTVTDRLFERAAAAIERASVEARHPRAIGGGEPQ